MVLKELKRRLPPRPLTLVGIGIAVLFRILLVRFVVSRLILENPKVGGMVVLFVSVFVVNHFPIIQGSTELLACRPTMYRDAGVSKTFVAFGISIGSSHLERIDKYSIRHLVLK